MRWFWKSILFVVTGVSVAQTRSTNPHSNVQPVWTPQEVLLLFAGQGDESQTLLTINNNRGAELTASLTAFTADGEQHALPSITLAANESRLIELDPILATVRLSGRKLGWLKLDYTGINMEVGAQLTLYPSANGGAVDSTRSLRTDFASNSREAVFWMPSAGLLKMGLTNQSSDAIQVEIRCGLTVSDVNISPKQTLEKQYVPTDFGRDGSLSFAGACTVKSSGKVDALRVAGIVKGSDGYAAPLRTYDLATSTSSSLTAVGVRTTPRTHVVVYNASDKAVVVQPTLAEAVLANPRQQTQTSLAIGPHFAIEVDVADLFQGLSQQGIQRATFNLASEAPVGALVGALSQIDPETNVVEDVPLRTANPPAYARGAYPLRWDSDYTNFVTVTNTASETRSIIAYITTGKQVYSIHKIDVAPGTTAAFDVDELRRDQVPDILGHTIPLSAASGKFQWLDASSGKLKGLMGRQSLVSRTAKRRSSFSCGASCQYGTIEYLVFMPGFNNNTGNGFTVPYHATLQQILTKAYQYGGNYTYDYLNYSDWASSLSTSSDGVMSFGPDATNTYAVDFYGEYPGGTILNYPDYFEQFMIDDTETYCEEEDSDYPGEIPFGVAPEITITTDPGADEYILVGGTTILQTTSSPAGGTYSWTASSASVSLLTPTDSNTTVTGLSAGDALINVTYMLNGASDADDKTVHVQVPKYFVTSGATHISTPSACTAAGYNGYFLDLSNYVADQNEQRISVSGIEPVETKGGQNYPGYSNPTTTRSDGSFDDTPFGACYGTSGSFCSDVSTVTHSATYMGNTYTVPTTYSGRSCTQGIKVIISGNLSTNQTIIQGTVY